MKASELRKLNVEELNERLTEEQSALNELTFTKAITGQVEKSHMMVQHRRNIAKIHTVLSEIELAAKQA